MMDLRGGVINAHQTVRRVMNAVKYGRLRFWRYGKL
jgi:hypothetical protein